MDKALRLGTVCSGIGAPELAGHALGWQSAFTSEIEPFPSAVLAHHFPAVTNMGDMTKFKEWNVERGAIDVFCGGTPCQSFSVAGLRGGMGDLRGNMAMVYCQIAARLRSRWLVWENVPGVLSSGDGRDFGRFLGALGQCGYGWAYRVLDAKYYGVPQQRRRVILVGYLGDWRRAAAVLFESPSVPWHHPPRREAGEGATGTLGSRPTGGGGLGTSHTLRGRGNISGQIESDNLVSSPISTRPYANNASRENSLVVGAVTSKLHKVAQCFEARVARNGRGAPSTITPPLKAQSGQTGKGDAAPLVFGWNKSQSNSMRVSGDVTDPLRTSETSNPAVISNGVLRRLTPRECERLQGFPDDHTLIPYRGKEAKDGPRYKAIGNAMAVPVMRWVFERIEMVDAIQGAAHA